MAIKAIKQNVEVTAQITSQQYGPLFGSLDKQGTNTWMSIEIESAEGELVKEIQQLRHAVQRWFAKGDNGVKYHMISRVRKTSETEATFLVYKKGLGAKAFPIPAKPTEEPEDVDELLPEEAGIKEAFAN